MKPLQPHFAPAMALLLTAVLFGFRPPASTALAANAQVGATADQQWQVLRGFGRPPASGTGIGDETKAVKAAREISLLRDQADRLREFYQAYPNHAAAGEARRLELLALSHAARRGDTNTANRRSQLVSVVRADTTLTPEKRYEAVAWSRQAEITRGQRASRSAFLTAQEQITRDLISEFPTVVTGYESLLGLALGMSVDQRIARLRELVAKGQAPAWVRARSQRLLDRESLVGVSLRSILGPGVVIPPSKRVLVLYSWSKAWPSTLAVPKKLAVLASGADFVGVCLDKDITVARAAAAEARLPGQLLFDAQGLSSATATNLKLDEIPVVFLADQEWVIRDLYGADDFVTKIRGLNQ